MIHPRHTFDDHKQGQVFRFFDDLPEEQQDELTRQAASIDLEELDRLQRSLIQGGGAHEDAGAEDLAPANYIPLPCNGGDAATWEAAREAGEAALRAGRVAAFTVAGGQGTRLGYDGPKGSFPVTPVRKATLFQVFAEKIHAAGGRYGKPIPWFIMTSEVNHDATVSFFEENDHFGLDPERVHFFSQGLMPAVDDDGKILLAGKGQIALSPDGHGGSLRALVRSGAIEKMDADGIDVISYFQVDNPLVRCIDPEFIGFHLLNDSELSSKTVPKAYPEEKVGVFCESNGRTVVVEYSDPVLGPQVLAADDAGKSRFPAGSIAIHIFSRDFVQRIGSGSDPDAALPFHRAHKRVPFVDPDGSLVEPDEPNAWKFEMFVFDALPFAQNPVIIETAREDDFSPVKNAEGNDSPQTSRDDQLRQFARWAKAAGVAIEPDETGLPPFAFEVTPLFADTGERFIEAWDALEEKPDIGEGTVLDQINRLADSFVGYFEIDSNSANLKLIGRTAAIALFAAGLWLEAPSLQAQETGDPVNAKQRVTALFELIEIDRAEWNAWVADPKNATDGPDLRKHVQGLLKAKRATIVEAAIACGISGGHLTIESIGEYIYPTEGDPAELAETGTAMTHRTAVAYETRNTGVTVELEIPGAMIRKTGAFETRRLVAADAELKWERVSRIRDDAHGKAENERVLPVFYTVSRHGNVKIRPGKSLLLSSHRPAEAAQETRKHPVHLAFLRIDFITLEK